MSGVKMLCATIAVAGTVVSGEPTAKAATILEKITVSVTASDFTHYLGAAVAPPVDPMTLSFSALYKLTTNIYRNATLLSSDVPYTRPLRVAFTGSDTEFGTYSPGGFLSFGNFEFDLTTPPGGPIGLGDFFYSEINPNSSFQSTTGTATISGVSAVPEPATWALMLIGVGGLGAIMRARRRADRDLAALAG